MAVNFTGHPLPGMPCIMLQPYDLEFLFTLGRATIIQEAYMRRCAASSRTDGRYRKIPIRFSTSIPSAVGKPAR